MRLFCANNPEFFKVSITKINIYYKKTDFLRQSGKLYIAVFSLLRYKSYGF
ncbi:hypothetical protein C789_3635 [Microcystis aeruginosa FACHB-905 = DIANCHI905]|nr:hypothetical protein C789_3635 [Microcystis aeruginosa FACHB-905 = DIANCHI905]